jgi:xanthine dehydrogenase accessory factor
MRGAPLIQTHTLQVPGLTSTGSWLQPLQNWPATVVHCLQSSNAVVRVVIGSVRGSSPREVGTSMVVDGDHLFGTIGGGQLEWAAISAARAMLTRSPSCPIQIQKLTLGPQLSQCCGGAVELWLERYSACDVPSLNAAADAAASGPTILATSIEGENRHRRIVRHPALDHRARMLIDSGARAELIREDAVTTLRERLDEAQWQVWLYGAGHVGQALARVLATLPIQLTWIDSRQELLPGDLPSSVRTMPSNDPVSTVADAPRNTRFLIMTHSHPLDYALCKTALERNDRSWIGVIGSNSKSVRFRSRLLREGLSQEQSDRLACPIGVGGIDSKLPAAIAISVAAQLLQTFDVSARSSSGKEGNHCENAGCKSCAAGWHR